VNPDVHRDAGRSLRWASRSGRSCRPRLSARRYLKDYYASAAIVIVAIAYLARTCTVNHYYRLVDAGDTAGGKGVRPWVKGTGTLPPRGIRASPLYPKRKGQTPFCRAARPAVYESEVGSREMVEGRDSFSRARPPELRCYSTPSGSEEERRGARRAWLTPGPLTRLRSSNYDDAREVGPGAIHIGPRRGPEVESLRDGENRRTRMSALRWAGGVSHVEDGKWACLHHSKIA